MKDPKTTIQQVITGILLPSQFDSEGNITGLAVYANTEDIYDVVQASLDRRLFDLLQKKIRVMGEILEVSKGRRSLSVRSFELIDNDEDYS